MYTPDFPQNPGCFTLYASNEPKPASAREKCEAEREAQVDTVKMTFHRKKPADPEEYREAVLEAEHFIRQYQAASEEGIYWNEIPDAGNLTFYRGSAGILYFYLQLFESTGQEEYWDLLLQGARYLTAHWHDLIVKAETEGEIVDGIAMGYYMGIGGIGAVLAKVWKVLQDETAKKGLLEILDYYKKTAVRERDGIYWSDNAPLYLDGGAVLFLLSAWEVLQDTEILEMLCQAADHLISVGKWHADGGLEIDHLSFAPKRDEPNFEFGTAGIGYLFARIYESSGREKYLEAAKATAVYLRSIAVPQENGYLIPYKLTAKEPLFYLGNCHGPAGTAKLFYQLYKVTGKDPYYYEQVLELTRGMESLGAPESLSPGYWNNFCICCGPAGLLPFYLGLYLEDGRAYWLGQAEKCGEILLGNIQRQKKGTAVTASWTFAFDRVAPDKLGTPAGYQNGTAGIAAMLLLLYEIKTKGKDFRREKLADDPFPEKRV